MPDPSLTDYAIVLDLSSLISIETIAEMHALHQERAEFIQAVASGVPASEVYHKIRHRRMNVV